MAVVKHCTFNWCWQVFFMDKWLRQGQSESAPIDPTPAGYCPHLLQRATAPIERTIFQWLSNGSRWGTNFADVPSSQTGVSSFSFPVSLDHLEDTVHTPLSRLWLTTDADSMEPKTENTKSHLH